MGFSINWRWQDEFLWESSFGVAEIPAYSSIDAGINIKLERLKSMLKIGGSNLLNKYYTTNLGSGQIGGLYYISLAFDEMFR
jgi:outer membrane receptor protein involved in Fe transport